MVDVELAIAANQQVFWRLDIGQASGQFGLGDIQVQASSGAVQFNPVTFLHGRQWPAGCGFRCYVQHHCAIRRAAHASIGNAHHIGHALSQQLGGQAHVAHFGHARVTLWPTVLHHQNRVGSDCQLRVIDAGLVHVEVLEDHGLSAMLHQGRGRSGWLEYRAQRRQVAAQYADTAIGHQRVIDCPDNFVVTIDR